MQCDEPDDLDEMIAKRTEANPDLPAMVAAAAARRAKLEVAHEGSPDRTEEKLVDDAGSPS